MRRCFFVIQEGRVVYIYLYIQNSSETIYFEPEIGRVNASHDVVDINLYLSFYNTQSKVWYYL